MGLEFKSPVIMVFLLMVLIVFLIVFFAPESLYAKAKDAVDNTVDSWLSTIKSEKIKQRGPVPDDIKKFFNSMADSFKKTGDKCLIEHPDFSGLNGYQIEISNLKDGIYLTLIKDKKPVDELPLSNTQVCVVAGVVNTYPAAKNFFNYYFNENKEYENEKKYTIPSKVLIVDKDTLKVTWEQKEKELHLWDNNLMYAGDEHKFCFLPTNRVTNSDEDGINDDYIASLKNGKIVKFCEERSKEQEKTNCCNDCSCGIDECAKCEKCFWDDFGRICTDNPQNPYPS